MSKVVLSRQTQEILKNFKTINDSILIRSGSVLKTISVGENAIAEYNCEEVFPQTFGIYDLGVLLSGLSLFDNPVIDFTNESYMTILGPNSKVKYYFSNPEITIKAAPEKEVRFPGADMSFTFTHEQLGKINDASKVFTLPDLEFEVKDDNPEAVHINVCDKEDDTCNIYSVILPGQSTRPFRCSMKMENVKLHHGDYDVCISDHLITEWTHKRLPLKYYIALEPQ